MESGEVKRKLFIFEPKSEVSEKYMPMYIAKKPQFYFEFARTDWHIYIGKVYRFWVCNFSLGIINFGYAW